MNCSRSIPHIPRHVAWLHEVRESVYTWMNGVVHVHVVLYIVHIEHVFSHSIYGFPDNLMIAIPSTCLDLLVFHLSSPRPPLPPLPLSLPYPDQLGHRSGGGWDCSTGTDCDCSDVSSEESQVTWLQPPGQLNCRPPESHWYSVLIDICSVECGIMYNGFFTCTVISTVLISCSRVLHIIQYM